jgi:membrane protease YdiL (CAAX protease family)
VFLAAIDNPVSPLSQWRFMVLLGLLLVSLAVYARYLRRLAELGPQSRPDLLALPEILAGTVILGLLSLTVAARYLPTNAATPAPLPEALPTDRMVQSFAMAALPAVTIIVLIIARGGQVGAIYGLRKVRLVRAFGLAFCLATLALPLTQAIKELTVTLTGSQEAPQVLVQKFNSAVSGNDQQLVGIIVISACVIAPIAEEILFRGTFYPMLARVLGRGPAAFLSAIFFGLMHDTYTDVPNLAVLALCFTLAYEVTGSLLVPIFMHMSFNGLSLAAMYIQAIGPAP